MKNHLSILTTVTVLSASLIQADLIFEDDFESYTAGQVIDTSKWSLVLSGADNVNTVHVEQDTGNLFGKGTGNQYVDLLDNSTNPGGQSIYLTKTGLSSQLASGIVTLNMNIIEPGGTPPLTGNDGRILVGIGDGAMGGTDRANLPNWNETSAGVSTYGTVPVTRDTLYNLNIVFNNSGSSIQYNSPSGLQTLNATSADIWVDGILQAENILQDRNWDGGIAVDSVGFRSFSGSAQRLLVDDYRVYDEALVIPEPSSLLLIGVALSSVLLFRRKH